MPQACAWPNWRNARLEHLHLTPVLSMSSAKVNQGARGADRAQGPSLLWNAT